MPKEMILKREDQGFYNDLRDEPCILCGDPYNYVLGSYSPDRSKRHKD